MKKLLSITILSAVCGLLPVTLLAQPGRSPFDQGPAAGGDLTGPESVYDPTVPTRPLTANPLPPLPEPDQRYGYQPGYSAPTMPQYGPEPSAMPPGYQQAPSGYAAAGYGYAPPSPPPTIRDFSWIYIDHPIDRSFKVNDIVTVIVSEKSEVTLNSRFNRQRSASLKSELKEFIQLDGGLSLQNSASTSPAIDANQQERIQSTGQVTDQEGITYRIAATVVDIRPNGNLVLEARKKINANDDLWEYTLHGEVRHEDVLRNNTVLSENIANLNIEKMMQGKVYSSTSRRWGNKLIDWVWPF